MVVFESRVPLILLGAAFLGAGGGVVLVDPPAPRLPAPDRAQVNWELPALPESGAANRLAREVANANGWGGRLAQTVAAEADAALEPAQPTDMQVANLIQRWRYVGSVTVDGRRTAVMLDSDKKQAHLELGDWLFGRFELVSVEVDQVRLQSAENLSVTLRLFGDNEIEFVSGSNGGARDHLLTGEDQE